MADYKMERMVRTGYSEAYDIYHEEDLVGRLDVHFAFATVQACLIVAETLEQDDIQEIIQTIDREVLNAVGIAALESAIAVFQGHPVGVFSDGGFGENGSEG